MHNLLGNLMEYIKMISENPYTPKVFIGIIFLTMLYGTYKLVSFILEKNLIRKSAEGFYKKTQEGEDDRKKADEILKAEEGMQEKISFLSKFDNIITYSNLRKRIPFVNAEIYLIFSGIVGIVTFLIVSAFSHWLIAIVFMIMSILIMFLIVFIMASNNYHKIEDNIMSFVNLMENYSKTSDDIVSIIGKISRYVDEPLKTALEECYAECLSTGNVARGFENLSNKVNHNKFKEIIRNVVICSRYEANYGEIVSESRNMLRNYLLDKKEKKALLNNARVELLLILFCSVGMMFMVDGFTTRGLIALLTDNMIGLGLLGYNIIIITLAICSVMFMGHQND